MEEADGFVVKVESELAGATVVWGGGGRGGGGGTDLLVLVRVK